LDHHARQVLQVDDFDHGSASDDRAPCLKDRGTDEQDRADMSMSPAGFIAGPDDDKHPGLGIDGEVSHAWLWDGDIGPSSHRAVDKTDAAVFDDMLRTGAVIVGRRAFEFAC
jgi:hypothetical protein